MNTEKYIYRLKEVANIGAGNSAPQNEELFKNGIYPFIRTSDVGKIHLGSISESRDKLNKEGIKGLKFFKKGTILFPKSGASTFLNHRVIMEIDGYVASHLATIKAKEDLLDDRYLLYFLQTLDSRSLVLDSDYPSLKLATIEDIELYLPPLSVQKQIVEKLDAAFADIDKAISATEKNIENAEALFQSYLNQIFETKGEGWESSTIEEAFLINPPKSELKEILLNSQVSFMGMNKLGINQKYSIPEEARDLEKVFKNYTYFRENDVLLAKITPCFENGKLGIAKELKNGIGFGSSEFVVLRTKSSISNEWLYYFLLRDEFRESGKEVMTGAVGHKRVPKEFIEKSVIDFPKLKSQEYIITNLESLQDKTSKLKELSKDKINNLIALKSSLLSQAFSGEFTKDVA